MVTWFVVIMADLYCSFFEMLQLKGVCIEDIYNGGIGSGSCLEFQLFR
jgi:hypothetical protein